MELPYCANIVRPNILRGHPRTFVCRTKQGQSDFALFDSKISQYL